ncbi:MAG TPA: ABC transporter permease [Candidatus Sulfotelmatobacter sp.]|nr:ABC transporter permease [Candidatus Sulfotelmatobacter sp.]
METLWQDIRYGLRMLAKNPGFTAIAVVTLALGIGANTALFSVVNAVLLNPMPYPHSEELVAIHESKPNFDRGSISYPNFFDWQKDNNTFAAMAISRGFGFSLTGLGEAEQINARFISSDYFPLLGVNPVIGRNFAPGEDRIGAAPVAMISAGLWNRKFSSSPSVLGKTLTLDGRSYTVVGVIPENFDLFRRSANLADVFVPIGQWNNPLLARREAGLGFHGIGRLKPGVTIQQARADMDRVTANLAAAYPDTDKGIGASLVPMREAMLGDVQPVLLVLLGAVGFVLLIACVNVANLLLARSTARTREFAIRAALGAGQRRLIRQLLTESILLALAGGALGLFLARWATQAALGVLPTELPRATDIRLDSHVLFFTIAISLLAGILFGLAPALKTSDLSLHETLKESARGLSGARQRTQSVFVVLEMAMALVLLVGAGLMVRTLAHLWNVDPGFDPHNVLTFSISLPPSMMNASPDAIRAAYRDVDQRFASTPGVRAVSLSWGAVPFGWDDEQLFWFADQPKPATENDMNWTISYVVDPEYLQVMRIPLLQGRFLSRRDDEHSPQVAVVDTVFAQKYFGSANPIGKRINFQYGPDQVEIVGVVGHVNQWGLDSDAAFKLRAELYRPFLQLPDPAMKLSPSGTPVMVRSDGSVPNLFDALRRTSRQMSSEQVIYNARTMDEIIAETLAGRRFSMLLFGSFAALALLLSSIGIYGVVSYLVGQRTHEIGIRIALGARRWEVLRLILFHGAKLAATGILIGLAASVGLTHFMSTMLFGVSATDPLTFLGVAIVLAAVALTACYVPARRATRVDPVVALRYE